MRYLPLTPADRAAMLARIGADDIDALFADVPATALLAGPVAGLAPHASEMAVERHMARLAGQNLTAGAVPFFLGAGAYRHHIPASVDHLIQRGEFLTAYTPYQPEIAQGTLQVLFEFQTQVARLFGTDIANASMYDGSTACWEAIAMAGRVTRRKKAVLAAGLHPHYVSTAQTMARFTGDAILAATPLLAADAGDAATIAAIERRLIRDGLVIRYSTEEVKDALPPGEGAFLACSFWLVDVYILQGRFEEAENLFRRLVGLCNEVGLLSEEYDSSSKRLVGNFPQAFSHMALVNSAYNLTRVRKPLLQRAQDEHAPPAAVREKISS